MLAAVRSATEGTAAGEQAAAPFADDRWLFSHNGRLDGWPQSAAELAAVLLPAGPRGAAALLSLEAMVDSAFLWALIGRRLRDGAAMDTALAATIAAAEAAGATGRFNFLLTDGRAIAATACGDTLWYRRSPTEPRGPGGTDAPGATDALTPVTLASVTVASVTVASEPDDDGPGWTEVPDRHVLIATTRQVSVRPLPPAPPGSPAAAVSPITQDRSASPGLPASHDRPRTHGVPASTTTSASKGS